MNADTPADPLASVRRVRRGYILALAILAVLTIVAQLFVQSTLGAQLRDAEIINLAGRQRMLSQRIARTALEIGATDEVAGATGEETMARLRSDLDSFDESHDRLLRGDLGAFASLAGTTTVRSLDRRQQRLVASVRPFMARASPRDIDALLTSADAFLEMMDDAVFEYSTASEASMATTRRVELGLAAATLFVLLLEALLIFGPMLRRLGASVGRLASVSRRLAESQRRHERAMEGSLDGIFEWARGKELFYSRNFRSLAELPMDQPASWDDFKTRLVPHDQERFEEALRQPDLDLELRLATEVPRWVRLRGKALDDGFVAGTLTDVDRYKRLEAERERLLHAREQALRETRGDLARAELMTSVGNLAAGVAHDFNNYLQVIKLSAACIDREGDGQDAESLAAIEEAADEASHLAHQLLAIRRGYAGERIEAADAEALMRDAEALIRRLLPANIEMMTEYDSLPPVLADTGQLRQVLINLCMNARDAMDGGGRLLIRARAERRGSVDGPVPGVEICVEDTGCGMTEEQSAHALDPFFTTKTPGKGTGLGLTMVHSIMRRHRGTLDIESAAGAGTTIRLWLPAADEAPRQRQRHHHRRETRGIRILLVDDEAALRRTGQRILERLGHHVVVAGSAAEALECIAPSRFDLIICDVMLPDGLGPQVLERVLRQHEHPPLVLFISGYSDAEVPTDTRSAFLRKPFDHTELIDAIDALLHRAEERAEPSEVVGTGS